MQSTAQGVKLRLQLDLRLRLLLVLIHCLADADFAIARVIMRVHASNLRFQFSNAVAINARQNGGAGSLHGIASAATLIRYILVDRIQLIAQIQRQGLNCVFGIAEALLRAQGQRTDGVLQLSLSADCTVRNFAFNAAILPAPLSLPPPT